MKLTVSIPTVRPHTLGTAINAVRKQTYSDWCLFVVGQGGDTGMATVVAEAEKADGGQGRIRYIHSDAKGISLARNIAISHCDTEIIAFTDDDCAPEPGWLTNIAACFAADDKLGLVGGPLLAPPDLKLGAFDICPVITPGEVTYDPRSNNRDGVKEFDFTGANFAVRTDAARRIGDFDPVMGVGALFLSAEDLDYKFRAESHGIKMRSTPKVVVIHIHGTRRGFKAVWRHRKSYAVGQGALAAKLTLAGDARGKEWVREVGSACTQTVKSGRLHRLPNTLLRYHFLRQTYAECLKDWRVESGAKGVLLQRL